MSFKKTIQCPPELNVSFQEKALPRGPAGCIRDAAESDDECLLVLPRECAFAAAHSGTIPETSANAGGYDRLFESEW